MPKLLIIGKDGFFGSVLARDAEPDFKVVSVGHQEMDITDWEQVSKILKEESPDVVVNTAALAKVEECEKRPKEAMMINALGSYNTAKISAEIGAKLVYLSTDYVFGGNKEEYTEEDAVNPINVYGISKVAGEQFVKNYNPRHYIIRSAVFFGQSPSGKTGFVDLMLRLAQERKPITVVDDLMMSPTNINDLSEKILEILRKEAEFGIYHITNSGQCTWYELARETLTLARQEVDLKPIAAKKQNVLAKRPVCSVLRSTRLRKAEISPARPWQEALAEYLKS